MGDGGVYTAFPSYFYVIIRVEQGMSVEGNVFFLNAVDRVPHLAAARLKLRARFNLSVRQAAIALCVSEAEVEQWERSSSLVPQVAELESAYAEYDRLVVNNSDKTFLFGFYPASFAREDFGPELPRIARKFGYGSVTWLEREIEDGTLRPEVRKDIEQIVSKSFSQMCFDPL